MHIQFEIIQTATQDISTGKQHSVSVPVMLLCLCGSLIPLVITVVLNMQRMRCYRYYVLCLFCVDVLLMVVIGTEAFISKSWSPRTWMYYMLCNILTSIFFFSIYLQEQNLYCCKHDKQKLMCLANLNLLFVCVIFWFFFDSLIQNKTEKLVLFFVGTVESLFFIFFFFMQVLLKPSRTNLIEIIIFIVFSVIILIAVAFLHVQFHAAWINMIGYFIAGAIYIAALTIDLIRG